MSYHVNRRWGASDDNPTVEKMREALAELDVEDIEHPDRSIDSRERLVFGGLSEWISYLGTSRKRRAKTYAQHFA